MSVQTKVVLEPAAQEFADATSTPQLGSSVAPNACANAFAAAGVATSSTRPAVGEDQGQGRRLALRPRSFQADEVHPPPADACAIVRNELSSASIDRQSNPSPQWSSSCFRDRAADARSGRDASVLPGDRRAPALRATSESRRPPRPTAGMIPGATPRLRHACSCSGPGATAGRTLTTRCRGRACHGGRRLPIQPPPNRVSRPRPFRCPSAAGHPSARARIGP